MMKNERLLISIDNEGICEILVSDLFLFSQLK